MKRNRIVAGIAVVLALAMVLCACKQEEEVEPGWLTITNLPSGYLSSNEYWGGTVLFEEEITSQRQLHNWMAQNSNYVASFPNSKNELYKGTAPFPLREYSGRGFLRSGLFLVCIGPYDGLIAYAFFMNVNFRNGRATIDFNDMTEIWSLPEYDE